MKSAVGVSLFFLNLVSLGQGYSKFDTACSTPSSLVNFVSSPDSRGTLDILWSCLFTIVACTWTIQHLNVPEQRRRRASGHGLWCDFEWALKRFWTNLKWMLATMLAPEFILGKALGDLIAAWECRELMRDFAREDNVEWGLAHGFYANMGGFVGMEETGQGNADSDPISLPAQILYWLRNNKSRSNTPKIESLPDITTEELYDKSKGDIFVKAIAIIQVFWVALQIIVRASKGLAISQLELAVAAFSACAIITYILLIPKPQGVRVPSRPIKLEPGAIDRINATEDSILPLRDYFTISPDQHNMRKRIPNDSFYVGFKANGKPKDLYNDRVVLAHLFGLIIGSVIFGSIHVAGWNLKFPTAVEQTLWRTSSIILTVVLPIIFLPFLSRFSDTLDDIISNYTVIFQVLNLIFSLFYIAARLFLLIEIFRTLLYLPPDAYVSTWASNIPHVA